MKAIFIPETGGPEVLTYGDVAEPEAGAGHLLLRVRAAALNRRDLFARAGSHGVKPPLPHVPGLEVAGEVLEAGPETAGFKAGDRVLARCRGGAYAEMARVEAAADAGIDYKEFPEFSRKVRELTGGEGVHVIFEHVGAPVWRECFASLRTGGRFVNSGVTAGHRVELHLGQLWTRQLTLMGTTMRPREDMPDIMELVRERKLRGVVSDVLPLREAARAHELMERSEFFGKIVLVP